VIAEDGLAYYEKFFRPKEHVVSLMEERGVPIDVDLCPVKAAEVQAEIDVLEIQLRGWAKQDINWGSPKQVAQFLYGTFTCPATKTGQPITPKGFDLPPVAGTKNAVQKRQEDKEPTGGAALEYLAAHASPEDREALEALMEWKDWTKLRGFWTNLPGYAVQGRIHPQLGPHTETGRLSSRNPNLQQIPPRMRSAFVAPPGQLLLELDYKALEWRILGHIIASWFGDTSIVDETLAGIDPHDATAEKMGKDRRTAKILNYSTIYMKTGLGLGLQLKIGEEAGEVLLQEFFEARPGIARFHREIVKYAEATGGVRSLLGRRRPITEPLKIWSKKKRKEVWGPGARQAANVVQNCAADIVDMAMLKVNTDPELKEQGWFNEELASLDCHLLLQVHDSLLFQVPEGNSERARVVAGNAMETCLEGIKQFLCPLGVSGGAGKSWGDCKTP
jgi:DNA polymerase-1